MKNMVVYGMYDRLKRIFPVMAAFPVVLAAVFPLMVLAQEHEPLEYEVSVKALQVPFVASDSMGNPVHDLKPGELELYVNGKLTDIIYLNHIAFGEVAEVETAGEEEKREAAPAAAQEVNEVTVPRLKFLIVDSLFNSPQGLKHAKEIARQLIEKCAPGDRFLLLEIQLGGLKYIAGPEPGGEPFLKYLDKLKKNPQNLPWWTRSEYVDRDGMSTERYLMEDGMRNARRDTVKMYLDAFEQFKNALRTIDDPKITFLLSEGFQEYVADGMVHNPLQESLLSYKGFEEYLVKEVHDGGSVLQKVHVGGLRGQHAAPLAAWLNRSTNAYYEAFFNPGPKLGEKMTVAVACKRSGVKIDAVAHKEKEKPYQKMNTLQKKLFAITVAAGGSYSRMMGRVKRIPFQKLAEQKNGRETQVKVRVPIPEEMKNRPVDVFALRFDDRYQDVDVAWERRASKEEEIITIPTQKNKRSLYFVIVEPDTAFCIYNQVL